MTDDFNRKPPSGCVDKAVKGPREKGKSSQDSLSPECQLASALSAAS